MNGIIISMSDIENVKLSSGSIKIEIVLKPKPEISENIKLFHQELRVTDISVLDIQMPGVDLTLTGINSQADYAPVSAMMAGSPPSRGAGTGTGTGTGYPRHRHRHRYTQAAKT